MLASGQPIPQGQDAPTLTFGSHIYWRAFWQLLSCRSALGVIPWTAIHTWACAHNISQDLCEDLYIIIPILDNEFTKLTKVDDNASNRKQQLGKRT